MGYVASGEFEEHLREIFGPLKKKKRTLKKLDFSQFESELAEELSALRELAHTYTLPKIGGLRWSDFCSIPSQYGADADEMRDQYEVVDQESLDLFMESVEVFNDSGNPFFTVCDAGVCVAFDDPFEIGVWHDDFQTFLSFLVWLSAAATGHTPLSEIESVFEDEFEIFEGESFLENAIEEAKTHADPRH